MKNLGTEILNTARLTLRRFTVNDAEAMFENWANDPAVTHFLTWTPHGNVDVTKSLLEAWVRDYENLTCYNWAIVLRGEKNDDLIGNISLLNAREEHERAELGYCMSKRYWGKGIMTEALSEVLRYAFTEVGFHRITGRHASENYGSSRVMEKCGLIYEGTMREYFRLLSTGQYVDIVTRGILRKDYLSRKP